MKTKEYKKAVADSLLKIILVNVHNTAKTGLLHLQDSLKLTPPDSPAAKSLLMAENAINACIKVCALLITTLWGES